MVIKHKRSQKLHETLNNMITRKKTGDQLPTEPELSRQLGVSRTTLREAMRPFETQGMITRRQGSGTYVSRPKKIFSGGLEILESIDSMAKKSGLIVSMDDLVVEYRAGKEDEAKAFNIKLPFQVTEVKRIILVEDHPVAFLVDVVPDNILSKEDLEFGFNGSILDILLRISVDRLAYARAEIKATAVDRDLARSMRIQRGDAMLCLQSNLFTIKGQMIDISTSYF